MSESFTGTPFRPLTPLWIIVFFVLLSAAVLLFQIPERITAIVYLCFFFLLASLNPINGIALMILSIPFFLGAPHKPYFFLFEIIIYGTLLIGFLHLWRQKRGIKIPFKNLLLLLAFSGLFSLPLNTKEYYYEFWATPFKDIGFQWLTGHEKFTFIHLRVLSNNLSGILLFVLTFNLFSQKGLKDLEGIWKGLVGMAVVICLIGFLFLFNVLPSQQKAYLSLSLAGIHEDAISVFAFNRQYLAQYLIILFPIPFYFLYLNRRKIPFFTIYFSAVGIILIALSASMQRSAYLVLFLETFLLIFCYTKIVSTNNKTNLLLLLIPFFFLGGMVLIDLLFLNKRFLVRVLALGFSDPDQRRYHLWNTAWQMFTFSPLLGIGLGKYYSFFPEFFQDPQISWKVFGFFRGEPHSFYLQTLSEQGAIGFLLFVSLVAAVIYKMIKKTGGESTIDNKQLLKMVLMISLLSWFFLGFFHNVSYVRSLGILFWIILGWAVSLVDPRAVSDKGHRKNKGFLVGGLLVLTLALGYQIKLIYDRPLSPVFQTGLYGREVLPGGEKIRWMGKRAVFPSKIHNETVVLFLSAPLPGIARHPQRVRIWAGKNFREVILKNDQWVPITIPIKEKSNDWIPLKIETDYTFNPHKLKMSRDDRNLGIMIKEIG
ncbi:MAG: O-antigen ligase family protein [Deltaproteobacteria bacterium]|nr:O-antigen ligase family protein [Deltaproteobacteria bacterium]